jgi:hypothetical protein
MSTLSLAVPAYPQVVLETSWRRRRIRALRDARCRRKRHPASAANFSHGQRIARHQGHDHIGARRIADQGTVQIRLSVRQIFSLLISKEIWAILFLFQPLSLFPVTLSTSFMKRLRREPPSEISPLPPSRIPADKERLNASTASIPSSMVPFATKLITRTGRI